jgi:hypothetical protein
MLVFSCPQCGAKLQMADDLAGKKVRCASCKSVVTAPASSGTTDAIQAEDAPVKAKASSTGVVSGAGKSGKSADRDDADDRPRRRSGGSDAATAAVAASAGIGVGGIIAVIVVLLGCLGGCGVVGILIALLLPAVQNVRQAAAKTQTMNNMKQIALAHHNHHDTFKTLPPPKMNSSQNNQPVELSWRVALLPFLEQGPLFNRFDQTSAWNSPRNQGLQNPMPMLYDDPLRDSDRKGGETTRFQYFTGPGTVWPDASTTKRTLPEFTAGTSNTILFAEAANPVPWTKPQDMAFQPGQPIPVTPDNFIAAFADGSVRPLDRRRAPDAVLQVYLDPKNNNPHQPID